MKKCLVIGKPNAGKTLFMLNFAEYLGFKKISIEFAENDLDHQIKEYTIEEAKAILSSNVPYKTTCLQSIEAEIPVVKGKKKIDLIDSSGLIDGIHEDYSIRKAMAQTLGAVDESDVILHMMDASTIQEDVSEAIGKVDYQLAQYGRMRRGYVILANKMDLLDNKAPVVKLQRAFSHHYVIPISALTKQGFGEVRSFVSRRL